ncbi:hypothetical protein [Chromobacterium sp. ATCC 53434]|uniref:hypothetical protein n=1 Tax=Chromobacterium sp. (strain ATCC 53434 / SC 14030) TaxID=2059672 RepID=UPI00130532CC|nr:hypothetical protein [Chromobacterium sp. ATCC 53434]
MTTIGIVGGSGAVGSAAAALLRVEGLTIRAGHRGGATDASPDWRRVDVFDDASLAAFCSGCALVLNAAGPSSLIGDRVLRAALAAGADYVDAYGGEAMALQLARLAPTRRVVHSAGVFPGLSALLPAWMAERFPGRPRSLKIWAGGRERCTPAAARDVLLSTLDGFGRAGAAWRDGRLSAQALAPEDDAEIVGVPGRVHLQPFLSGETERLAARLGLDSAEWRNIAPDGAASRLIARYAGLLALSPDDAELLERGATELAATAQAQLAGHRPYYRMVAEMDGWADGGRRRLRAVLRAEDSYRISGAVAAAAALALLDGSAAGGPAADVLLPGPTLARLESWPIWQRLDLAELAMAGTPTIEEGAL